MEHLQWLLNISFGIGAFLAGWVFTRLFSMMDNQDKLIKWENLLTMKEIMYAYSLGLISLYYNNSDDGDKEQLMNEKENKDCSSGACKL